ncbi:hypothetical protein NP233_g8499 [Leucocoprinus birnbaumii]|uniref:Uncharacterized protein n=1 Tax=Leucocoprinus birnbaumii TaxID=56174 RepID=A0AAD5YTT9_9AGAR|nr:hypothetical protein NP233_g8499 [Leucocoprinus birnbaumii]
MQLAAETSPGNVMAEWPSAQAGCWTRSSRGLPFAEITNKRKLYIRTRTGRLIDQVLRTNAIMASHGDIERELYTLFTDHPSSHVNDSGEPVIPADALVDVLSALTDVSNVPLLSDEETTMLKTLLENNPGLEVTPSILLQFIAEKTRNSPSPSPDQQDESTQQHQQSPDAVSPPRGREQERHYSGDSYGRSSSNESNGASYYSGSRPSSRGPSGRSLFDMERRQRSTPLNNAPSSWNSAKRPAPASRRRSIDGSLSRPDSEFSMSPTSFSRSTSGTMRTRTPSNPTSPSSSYADLGGSFSPISSPTFSNSYPRPLSRSGSVSASAYSQSFGNMFSPGSGPGSNIGDESLDDETVVTNALLNTSGEYRSDESFNAGISSLPMPSSSLSDSDSDDEQDSSLVLDRNIASSTASMEPLERLEALQRQNADLGRKLMEAERTLQNRLAEHESELEEMQGKLEEMRSELSATKREEKELRSKERQNTTQISALELEVSKITKALESAKSTYTSLQRQYQEQCTFSEKYRSDLRAREEVIRTLREAASLHELESNKWAREQQSYEERIAHLEEELGVAQGVYVQLDEQKQENMLLKETIDRMRFEMDEMRANAALGLPPGGAGGGSGPGTLSKTLGAELMGKMQWDGEGEEGDDEHDVKDADESVEEGSSMEVERSEDESNASVTAVEEDEDTEDEDVIQTIITRKKRKVASRAKELPHPSSQKSHTFQERTSGIEPEHSITLEELKEYSDIAIQYDPTLICVSAGVQTLPPPIIPKTTIGIQMTPPEIPIRTFAAQTDPPPPPPPKKITIEMEIQTEEEESISTTTTTGTATPVQGEGVESLASSSSTILPPTPKAHNRTLSSEGDEPPTYNQVAAQRAEEEKERRIVNEALARWHVGAKLSSLVVSTLDHAHVHDHSSKRREEPQKEGGAATQDGVDVEPIEGGVAEDLVEEWKALKEELGVDCSVIDRILEQSMKIPRDPSARSASSTGEDKKGKRRSGRFFNIYNTYVYGSSSEDSSSSSSSSNSPKSLSTTLTNFATQALLFASASAVVCVALTPYLLSSLSQTIPGGPSAYDRAAWASFNALGGGGGEGIAFAPRAAAGWLPGGAPGFDALGGGGGGLGNGQTTEAVWRVLERVGGGAARMARGLT